MKRREFIMLLGCAAAGQPAPAWAQQGQQTRRLGVLVNGSETDAEIIARLAAFRKALQDLGWTSNANLQVDVRYGADNDDLREKAKALVRLAPDVVLAMTPASVIAVRKINPAVPIVFAAVSDPVGMGLVQNLARPGGNATGFLSAEFGFGAKWLELLKEVAPGVRRVLVLTDLGNPSAAPQFAAIQTVASSFDVELTLLGSWDNGTIERGINDFARSANGGLIALRLSEVITHRKSIIKLAAQHRLPAVYPCAYSLLMVVWFLMGLTRSTSFAGQRNTSIASSRVKSQLTFRCRRRPSSNSLSILKQLLRSGLLSPAHYSPARTRSSNNSDHVRIFNRPFGVKRFQTVFHHWSKNVLRPR